MSRSKTCKIKVSVIGPANSIIILINMLISTILQDEELPGILRGFHFLLKSKFIFKIRSDRHRFTKTDKVILLSIMIIFNNYFLHISQHQLNPHIMSGQRRVPPNQTQVCRLPHGTSRGMPRKSLCQMPVHVPGREL